MNSLRKRLSYANIVATLALLFAISGGALAANHYLINSTKQINPKVLKKLAGKPGKNGLSGAAGPAGTPGTQGAKGEPGQPGISEVKTVEGPQVSNPHGTQVLAFVNCPAGTKAIGGGGAGTSTLPDQSINSSFARGENEGWDVEENNSSTTNDYKVNAVAVCAKVGP